MDKTQDTLLMFDETDFQAKLVEYASQYGIVLSTNQARLVVLHLRLMLVKNQHINLTAIRDPDKALILHSLDSLLFTIPIEKSFKSYGSEMRILDMGTGGGFPGIPLACVMSCQFVLVDSVGKKVETCKQFVDSLGIISQVQCVNARLEELALRNEYAHSFNCVVARALASLDVLIEYATPYLKHNGILILSKGNPDSSEVQHAMDVAKYCGLTFVSRETLELPLGLGHRELFTFKSTQHSKVKLPRKNGEARRKPLVDQL